MKIYLFIFLFFIIGCNNGTVEFDANNCKANPSFIKSFGYNPQLSYLSTSDERLMGLVLIESSQAGNVKAAPNKKMQHPSWTQAGWLAPILIAGNGDIFTAPAPFINILNNPIKNNNTVYKIDGKTGVMEEFLKLPAADSINVENPFGIIGMSLLCESSTLYVSSLAGSTRHKENGHIYAINIENGKVIDKIDNADAMGMGISYIEGKRVLYFGTGRNSDVFKIELNKNGKFASSPKLAFTLANLGIRGDDKVRKIRPDQNGDLIINGMEFNYNLIAPREKQEATYKFMYDEQEKKWNLAQ